MDEIEAVRKLLDQGLSTEARSRLSAVLSSARNDPTVLAEARCALATSLEMRGQFRESLDAVAMYEAPEERAKLDPETNVRLRVQVGLAYNYNSDHPKAIALLNAVQRDEGEDGSDATKGAIHAALARVYRSISE